LQRRFKVEQADNDWRRAINTVTRKISSVWPEQSGYRVTLYRRMQCVPLLNNKASMPTGSQNVPLGSIWPVNLEKYGVIQSGQHEDRAGAASLLLIGAG
jgi:hypothetical protein